jgi:hypothetical protein
MVSCVWTASVLMVRCEYDRQFVPAISMSAICAHTAAARLTNHENHLAMTPDNPGFAAAVRVARRVLAERIAAKASDERVVSDMSAAVPGTPINPKAVPSST